MTVRGGHRTGRVAGGGGVGGGVGGGGQHIPYTCVKDHADVHLLNHDAEQALRLGAQSVLQKHKMFAAR